MPFIPVAETGAIVNTVVVVGIVSATNNVIVYYY